MARQYGSVANSCWAAAFDYSTSSDNTSYSISITAGAQLTTDSVQSIDTTDGVDTFGSIKNVLSVTGKNDRTSWGDNISSGGSNYSSYSIQDFDSVSYSFSKTHSAQSITISNAVTVNNCMFWSGASNPKKSGSSTASTTITIPAKPSYTVSFNANGGSGAPGNQTKWYGENLTLSSTQPTRSGYTFVKWNTAANGSGTNYNPGSTYSGNSGVTLYAIWQQVTYSVSYNANGGSGAPSAQTKVHGTNLTLSSTKPTRSGYSFWHWNTNTSNTGTSYNSGATYSGNAALLLYAIWNPIVTFDANGGSGAPSAQTKTYGTNLTLSTTKPTRTGYEFWHWNTNTSNTGTTYADGGVYSGNTALTLYAIWNPIIYYNANGGNNAPSNQTKWYGTNLTLSSVQPTYDGFTFKRWNTNSNDSGTAYSPGAAYTANTTATLYAIWDHTVSYDANGGSSAPASQTALKGSAITMSSTKPTRPGHLFVKWNTKADGTGTDYQPGASFAADTVNTTMYAIWEVYTKPNISSILNARCDSSGNLSDEGTYMLSRINWSVTAYHGAEAPSSIVITVKSGNTVVATETITEFESTVSGDYATGVTETTIAGPFSIDTKYDVTIKIVDALNEVEVQDILTEAFYPLDIYRGGHGMGIGRPAAFNALRIGYNTDISGTVTCTSMTQTSDKRAKEHIKYIGDEALNFVRDLKPALFIQNGKTYMGFYAQEVEDIDPYDSSIVDEAFNGFLTLNYTSLIAPLVHYVQRLEQRIEELENGE
jgi:uncharacterized repeat protein (TIGR02543 family)